MHGSNVNKGIKVLYTESLTQLANNFISWALQNSNIDVGKQVGIQ